MNIKKLSPYFANLILIWFAVLIYLTLPFYTEFIKSETETTLLILASAYTIFGLIFHLLQKTPKTSKGLLILNFLKNLSKDLRHKKLTKIKDSEKNALLFAGVKFFFLPIMLNFFFGNLETFRSSFSDITLRSFASIIGFNNLIFPTLLTLIFMLDTLIFAFGYAFEAGFLKNKLRTVEPTILGWIVALACYPPFNNFTGSLFGWSANDYFSFTNETYTFILRISISLLLLIYLSATFALGAKSSNLTNRGIVTKGPYAIIRHPAYISKNLAWWLTVLPLGSIAAIIGTAGWSFVYHLRTVTEERHLNLDPDYREYCKKVRYRYIPGIY